ncbi:MAG: NAD-dependent epimerase/dehydratase family protein [Dehalococcoidia bacterium]|nr:MAG: NAD-dependent epimerase/dehydratase family protein [Dehalococcoidia bacterium]
MTSGQRERVAVIGSNSFSGSDFVDLLLETGRYEVLGVSRSPEKGPLFLPYLRHGRDHFRFMQADLNHDQPALLAALDEFEPAFIVNFAAQSEVAPSWEHPEQWFQTNAVALTALFNALKDRRYLRRYVHISSPEVYGTCEGRVTEDAPLNPTTPYAASKAAGDLSLMTYVKNFGFPAVMIRATNVYGAHQQLFKIIPRTAIYLRLGKTIELHGGGHAVKSYIHIRDVSRGELAAMERGRDGLLYHLSPDAGVAVRDVVARMCVAMGCDFATATREVGERLGQDAAYVIDSTRARTEFGWRPEVGLDEGLAAVARWVDEHWDAIQGEPLEYVHRA